MKLFDDEFILLLERWVVIPFVGYLISHGFFAVESKSLLIPVFDNILGTLFVFVMYYLTHKKTIIIGDDTETKSVLNSLWIRFSQFALKKKEVYVPKEKLQA